LALISPSVDTLPQLAIHLGEVQDVDRGFFDRSDNHAHGVERLSVLSPAHIVLRDTLRPMRLWAQVKLQSPGTFKYITEVASRKNAIPLPRFPTMLLRRSGGLTCDIVDHKAMRLIADHRIPLN
jgi:hypothetical protein